MEMHRLEPNVIAKIRSSATINSLAQCIIELVLNSLDAKSTAIAVRINFVTFRIQVVDNGDGIIKDNLNLIGQRYMTSKCINLVQLESHCGYFGYRGEALASIINISKLVEITSRPKDSAITWSRSFKNCITNDVISVKDRPSCGTTVTIEGFLYNLPLRKKHVIPEVELVSIKRNIECLTIMHPGVTFSLRNDVTGDLILHSRKCNDIISAFQSLHPEVNSDYSLIKVSKNNVSVKGLLFQELFESNYLQYIYVNKRPVKCSKIQVFINNFIQKNKNLALENFRLKPIFLHKKNKHPIYIINIKCPYTFVDILSSPTKTVVEFKDWSIIFSCIEKLLLHFTGGYVNKISKESAVNAHKVYKSDCGISQINGVFKSYGLKRKCSIMSDVSRKMQRLNNIQNMKIMEAKEMVQSFQSSYKHNNDPPVGRKSGNSLKNTNDISEFSDKYEGNDITNTKKVKGVPNTQMCVNKRSDLKKKIRPIIRNTRRSICPLPIEIHNKNTFPRLTSKQNTFFCTESKAHNPNRKIENNAICNTIISTKLKMHEQTEEKSFLSKFTNDEYKGKNLIMDIFLKSTQVYNSEDEYQSDKRSEDTVLEVESNYLLKNNITTNVKGKSKTMSVSVNITKKIKKKCKINKQHYASKLVQTSFNQLKTRCVQTSMCQNNNYDSSNIICNNVSDDTKLAENCTIILSHKQCKPPKFKFVYRNSLNELGIDGKIPLGDCNNYCKCNCHLNSKGFYFDNHGSNEIVKNTDISNDFSNFKFCNIMLSPIETFHRYTKNTIKPEINFRNCKPTFNSFTKNRRQFEENETYQNSMKPDFFDQSRSPYFLKKYEKSFTSNRKAFIKNSLNFISKNNISSTDIDWTYNFFCPQFRSTQRNQLSSGKLFTKRIEHNSIANDKLHNFQNCDATYSMFSRGDTQCRNHSMLSNLISSDKAITDNCNIEKDAYSFKDRWSILQFAEDITSEINVSDKTSDCKETSVYDNMINPHHKAMSEFEEKLLITLSNRQKELILENELNIEKNNYNKLNLEWESQMATCEKEEDAKQYESEEFAQEWIRTQNNFGSNFYINRRTGFTTFYTPKLILNDFKFCNRFEFMPKGLSPILKDAKEVDESLSQNKKNKLESYILESHQNELLIIKWQNYIKNNDPKTFFDEVYREQLNQHESCIPTALYSRSKKYLSELNCPVSFDKVLFNNIFVIGQVDKKFIAVLEKTKNLLILFDQHAVHERIMLEELLEGYSNTKIPLYKDISTVFLSSNDLSVLKKHEDYLNFLGLSVEFFKDGINVVEVPLSLYNKFRNKGS